MLEKLELRNFVKFVDMTVDFSPKINILIGENGTGKTQILKVANTVCSALANAESEGISTQDGITLGLIDSFMPVGADIGRLVNNEGASDDASIKLHFSNSQLFDARFSRSGTDVQIIDEPAVRHGASSIFIPSKEIMSMFYGMKCKDSDTSTINRMLDKTYRDFANQLLANKLDSEDIFTKNPRYISIKELLDNAIGGEYLIEDEIFVFRQFIPDGKYVIDMTNQNLISANMTAEGIRKLGALQRLNANGSFGKSGPNVIFWDEPETNINPKLMRLLVEVLLELSRNGQQIILATHDYVLLKWFDLLTNKGKGDHIRFHSLYCDSPSRDIKISSTDNYLDIAPNAIDEAFAYLVDKEIENEMGSLGK
jgi:energy-coupling factor transporter ATP-binding protein EcfA2